LSGFTPLSANLANEVINRMSNLYCGDKDVFYVPPTTQISVSWTTPASIAISIITIIYLILKLFAGVFLFIYRDQKAIKSGSILFLSFILFGLVLVDIVILLWNHQLTKTICQVQVWFAAIAFILVYGSIFCKTWRLYRIWTAPLHKIRAHAIKDDVLLLLMGGLLITQIIILLVWLFVDPFKPLYKDILIGTETFTQVSCGTQYIYMEAIIYTYMALILVIDAAVAYFTRNLPKNYREASWIALCVYNTIFSCILLPVAAATSSVINQYILLTVELLWTSLGVFVSLILLKILAVLRPDIFSAEVTSTQKSAGSERMTELKETPSITF